jgi:hypothetical protein
LDASPKLSKKAGHAWERGVQAINLVAGKRATFPAAPRHRLVDDGNDQCGKPVPAIFQRSLQEFDDCRPLAPSDPEVADTGLGGSKRESSLVIAAPRQELI